MDAFGTKRSRKHTPNIYIPGQYLLMSGESRDVRLAGRGAYGFQGRYLLKRRVARALRRLKHQ